MFILILGNPLNNMYKNTTVITCF